MVGITRTKRFQYFHERGSARLIILKCSQVKPVLNVQVIHLTQGKQGQISYISAKKKLFWTITFLAETRLCLSLRSLCVFTYTYPVSFLRKEVLALLSCNRKEVLAVSRTQAQATRNQPQEEVFLRMQKEVLARALFLGCTVNNKNTVKIKLY